MLKTLLIRPHPFKADLIQWGVLENQLLVDRSQGYQSIDTLPQAEEEYFEVVCLAPSARFFVAKVELPNVNPRMIKRALPFAIEEQVATDVETLHLSVLGKESKQKLFVSAVEHELMRQWVALGNEETHGPITQLVPDALCVPHQAKCWELLVEEDDVYVRIDEHYFIYSEHENVVHILDALYQESDAKPEIIRVYLKNPDGEKLLVASLENHLAMSADTAIEVQSYTDALELLANEFFKQDLENHLQGDYRLIVKKEKKQSPWRLPLALAAVWAVFAVGHYQYQAVVIEEQALTVKKASRDLYRTLFPDTQRTPRSIKRSMQSKLSSEQAPVGSFVGTLVQVGQVRQQSPFNSMLIKSIRFNEKRGGLLLEMNANTVTTFDEFKTALVDQGLNAELTSVASQEGTVFGRVRIGDANG